MSSNGDSIARDARISSQGGIQLSMTPLRTLTVTYGERRYRLGPDCDVNYLLACTREG